MALAAQQPLLTPQKKVNEHRNGYNHDLGHFAANEFSNQHW